MNLVTAMSSNFDPPSFSPRREVDGPRTRHVVSDRSLRYVHHRPSRVLRRDLVLVSVHGISRNARAHAEAFAPLADRLGCHLVAPRFPSEGFSGYQQLGLDGRGARADMALQRMLADLRRFGVDADAKLVLIGFSGGAQFAHRYALLHPARVAALAVVSAGWYTSIDADLPFPRGCGADAGLGLAPDVDALLRTPMLLMVGDADTDRDRALRRDVEIDAAQGLDRVERATNWALELSLAAEMRALPLRCRFERLAGASHDFDDMVSKGLVDRVTEFVLRQV